ncbi:MAG: AP2 domain-containing protein [Bacteroidales bacterium]|jgi:hypothetical protein
MKEIKLTQGKVALVDDEDFEELNQFKWYACKRKNTFYAARDIQYKGNRHCILMHRKIMKTPNGLEVDHKDGNGCNCQKENMRNCAHGQNQMNRGPQRTNTSGYKGVSWSKAGGKWVTYIQVNGKSKNLGYHDFIEDAARAYNEAAIKFHGKFAYLNAIGA